MRDQLPAAVSTIVFDVGNTLHHLDHAFIAANVTRHSHAVTARDVALAEYAAKAGVDADFRTRVAGVDATRRFSYFETLLAALDVRREAFEAIGAALKAEDQRASLWRVMEPDTPAVIATLRQRGYQLAVVSNADGRVAGSLATSGLAKHFTTIVDSHVVGVEKPDARIFAIALQACGAAPAQAIYVGDIYEIDIRGARNAGMTGVLLDPLGGYPGDLDCPRIRSLGALLDLLASSPAHP